MSDSEYEEETSYVVFDIGTSVTPEYIEQVAKTTGGCRLLGLEEGHPYLQIGEMTFEGQVNETIGTHLMFEMEERKVETSGLLPLLSSIRGDDSTTTSENDNSETLAVTAAKPQKYTLKYDCSTENIIKMDTVNIRPKQEPEKEETDPTDDGATLAALF